MSALTRVRARTRALIGRLDRHTVAMCRPPFPYDRLAGRTD